MGFFVGGGGGPAQGGVVALAVVEDFDVVEHGVGQLRAGGPFLRSRSSTCILPQKDSIIALSYPSPMVPSAAG